jgi:hypothetical protein
LTSASVGDYPGLLFALSPFTMAVFTGHADLSVRTTVGVVNGPGVFASETANASFSLQVSGPAADGGQGSQQSTTGRSASASWESVYNPSTGQFTYTGQSLSILDVSLATSFTNFTTAPMSGYMNLTLNASGNSAVPAAVPEPASYALMALGLTVLAIARRRR